MEGSAQRLHCQTPTGYSVMLRINWVNLISYSYKTALSPQQLEVQALVAAWKLCHTSTGSVHKLPWLVTASNAHKTQLVYNYSKILIITHMSPCLQERFSVIGTTNRHLYNKNVHNKKFSPTKILIRFVKYYIQDFSRKQTIFDMSCLVRFSYLPQTTLYFVF